MLEQQNSACAICFQCENGERLSVDHCHRTGEVRGLLCSKCNLALGGFSENIERLQSAIQYLEKHKNIIYRSSGLNDNQETIPAPIP